MSMSSMLISTHSLLQPTALRDMAMPCVNNSFTHSFIHSVMVGLTMEKRFQLQLRIVGASRKMEIKICSEGRGHLNGLSLDLTRLKVRKTIQTRTNFCITTCMLCIVNQDLRNTGTSFLQWF